MTRLKAIGQIAGEEGVPVHRIAYIINTRRIEPTQRAGNLRLFDETAAESIRLELRRIDRERRQGATR